MATRWEVERALFESELTPQARLIALTLLAKSDAQTAVVPAEFTPSLSRLATMTGLSQATVKRALNALEEAGWVERKRPDIAAARANKDRTQYRLHVPGAGLTVSPEDDETGLSQSPARLTQSPELGSHRARGWAHSEPQVIPLPDPGQTSAQRVVEQATGATADEAAAITNRIKIERQPRSLVGLVKRLAVDGDLDQLLVEVRSAAAKAEVSVRLAELKRGPECEHLVPGGASPHPSSRLPICPQCRRKTAQGAGWGDNRPRLVPEAVSA